MTRVRSRRLRARAGEGFTDDERASLLHGGLHPFTSHAERRAAWRLGRDHLMTLVHPAARPAAFWEYEPGVPRELREAPRTTVEAFMAVIRARRAWAQEHR